jgi:transcriptional activator of cad operon
MESQPLRAFRVGAWRVDPAIDAISQGETTVKLVPRTMKVLCVLAGRAGEVVSQEEIEKAAWPGVIVTSSSVYQAITDLRRTLGDNTRKPTYVMTVPRKGYRLIAPVAPDVPELPEACAMPSALVAHHVPAAPASDMPAVLAAAAARRWWRFVIPAALTVVVLIAAGWLLLATRLTTESHPAKSIAVLPMADLSENADQGRFADGLTDEMTTTLGQVPGFRIAARTSSKVFRGRAEDVRAIGRTLGARYVVEGSIRRGAGRIRVSAQLIDTATGYQLWSSTFDRPADDMLAVQEEIATAIASALQLQLE